MVFRSYAKINLSLTVNSRRKNRLHEIQSLYCWINLFDKIEIKHPQQKKESDIPSNTLKLIEEAEKNI